MIKLLNNSERESLREIYRDEFDSLLPDEVQANIVAITEDDEIQAFLTSEVLIRVGLMYVKPEHRNTVKSARMARQLARYVATNLPKGASVIAIDTGGFEKLFERLKMEKQEGTVYRIDFE